MTKRKAAMAAGPVLPAGETVHIYPDPEAYAKGDYLAGVPLEGTAVTPELAAEWLAAGLVSLEPPAAPPDQSEA